MLDMATVGTIIGGVGLFLLGMILLTDGLKALAGDFLRSILERFVRGPVSGLAWGTGLTALIQSSSATTLMTIGFVSAGLLTFTQSIGLIFGANLGTTSTGWIVSTIGLKFSMSAIALPIIGIGAVMRLLGRERLASLGIALAGFGLIFVGIDTLQTGMTGLAERIDPASFPGMTLLGIPALVIIGAVMTVVMQSSSAAVAVTLAALYTGAIGLEQAAVLVIGQNIGTTVKAALASIGASIPARRTAIAHILFNIITALLALAMLPVFLWLARWIASFTDGDAGAVSIAAFHTTFNIVGVAVILPFTARFAQLVERLVPERKPALARNLDISVADVPSIAVEAVRRTTIEIAKAVVRTMQSRLEGVAVRGAAAQRLRDAEQALHETRRFLGRVSTRSASQQVFDRHLASVHAVDHLSRMVETCREPISAHQFDDNQAVAEARAALIARLPTVRAWLKGEINIEAEPSPADAMEQLSRSIADTRRAQRAALLEQAAAGTMSPDDAVQQLDALIWLDRLAYHLARALHHLQKAPPPPPPPSASSSTPPDDAAHDSPAEVHSDPARTEGPAASAAHSNLNQP